jgi:hypothetical protein
MLMELLMLHLINILQAGTFKFGGKDTAVMEYMIKMMRVQKLLVKRIQRLS